MGILDMLLDNSGHAATVAGKLGIPEAQAKQALDKIVPVVRDRYGGGKPKPAADEKEQTAQQVAKETGIPVETVRKMMEMTMEEAYKDPRFVAADLADGKLDGKIGKPVDKK